jgi:hypothetical protein
MSYSISSQKRTDHVLSGADRSFTPYSLFEGALLFLRDDGIVVVNVIERTERRRGMTHL